MHSCDRTAYLLLIVCCAAVVVVAEVTVRESYDAGFQFVEEPVNPRVIAMGTAGTALDERGWFYYNPALPGLMGNRFLSVEYGQQSGDVRRAVAEGAWVFPRWFLAAGVPTNTIADIIPATEQGPNFNVPFSSQGTMISIGAGLLWKGLSVALCFNGLQDRIDVYAGYALTVSAGAAYWIIPEKLSVGAAGFYPRTLTTSRSMLTEEWGEGAPVNRTARVGVAWRDSLKSIPYAAALDIVYNDALENVAVPVGIEVYPLKMLAVRMGKRFNHDTDAFNFGLGLRFAPIRFDASFVVTRFVDDTGLKWLLGLAYSLPRN